MTKNGKFKRRVRARVAKTGEAYSTARMQLLKDKPREAGSVRLAVAQMTIRMDPGDPAQLRASGAEMRDLMKQAHRAGADLVHFPEGATCFPDKRILSETGPETIGAAVWERLNWSVIREEIEATRQLAQELGLWIVFGSVHELTQPQRPHNSLFVVSDQGALVTRYDERMLSNTKISFMYTPGAMPITFDVKGFRFGCALGMESHFPEVFIEYEELRVDCVLFSTASGPVEQPNDAAFSAEVQGHAASNSYWVSYAVPAKPNPEVVSGIVTPRGQWAAQCASDGMPSVAVYDIYDSSEDPARPWRRSARSGIYAPHRVENDPRSNRRDAF